MATPAIRSVGSSSGTVNNLGRNNLVAAETVTLSDTNPANVGHTHAWSFVDKPQGSSASLTTPSGATSTFQPDVTGSYMVKCVVDGTATRIVILAVPLAVTGARIPAFSEALEYDAAGNTKGWHEAMTAFLRAADTNLFVSRYIRETAGPTVLTVGSITNNQILQRVGSTVVGVTTVPSATTAATATLATTATFATTAGGAPPTGAASGQLGGTFPGPDVRGIRETSGPTLLTLGAVADTQMLVRSGSTVVGQAVPTGLPPTGAASGDLGGSFPSPTVLAIHETSGPTKLTIGTLTDGEFLKRVGSTLVSAAISIQAYSTVQAAGSPLTQRSVLNFGSDFTAADNGGSTRTDVSLVTQGGLAAGAYTSANVTVNSKGVVTAIANSSPVSILGQANTYSIVDIANATVVATSNVAGNQTVGTLLFAFKAMTLTGIRFYWKRNASDRTFECALWSVTTSTTGTKVASVDVLATTTGVYVGTFSVAQSITANTRFMITIWDKSGSEFIGGLHGGSPTFGDGVLNLSSAPCAMVGPYLMLMAWRAGASNAFPNAIPGALGDVFYPIEPVLNPIVL